MSTKRQGIWRFFSAIPNEPARAQCDLCPVKCSRGSEIARKQTTSNMRAHLKKEHKLMHDFILI